MKRNAFVFVLFGDKIQAFDADSGEPADIVTDYSETGSCGGENKSFADVSIRLELGRPIVGMGALKK